MPYTNLIYQIQYGGISNGMKGIFDFSVKGLQNYMMNDILFYFTLYNYLIFRPVRTVVNYYVFEDAVGNVIGIIKTMFMWNAIAFFSFEAIILCAFYFAFIVDVEKKYKNVMRMKKVFQLVKDDA